MSLPLLLLRSLYLTELQQLCQNQAIPRFRAGQIYTWVQVKGVADWEEMSNVPLAIREKLSQVVEFAPVQILRSQTSRRDGTRKYLFELADQQTVETVLMLYDRAKARDRATVCVSTQVGCAMKCAFCATGLTGLVRNLAAGEIVGQVLDVQRVMRREDTDAGITNVVFMGMGEPLQNYANLSRAINLLNSTQGQNIGMRRMTVSTCGVVPRIIDLARDFPQITLAISLHAPRDAVRDRLVPINRHYPLQELMTACRKYIEITNKRITFEYALIKGVNSSAQDARDLSALLGNLQCHLNLIPVNSVQETGLTRPAAAETKEFVRILTAAGMEVTLREEKGTDIDAACGQLRKRQDGEG
ncbi:MAG: 23S rRNA (adenine(2503)-C(2))-methyltransferase RlmN [Peptococcaceae bacterium]|nr:23S rRNA (adenine(2503)-C(2))-methyltransferase RlmN [Peptococcaceae bacterium]